MSGQPWLFKWRQFEAEIIVCAVRWYLRYSLSYREVQELLVERGIRVDHSTIWRWVQRYAPELELRQREYLKPTNKSWRVDETYVKSRASGAICIERWTLRGRLSSSSSRCSATNMQPRACSAGPSGTAHLRPGSSTPIRPRRIRPEPAAVSTRAERGQAA